jgi:hypothetical protein
VVIVNYCVIYFCVWTYFNMSAYTCNMCLQLWKSFLLEKIGGRRELCKQKIKLSTVLCAVNNTYWFFFLGEISEDVNLVRFQVLTAASMKMAVFWVVAPCSLVEVYWRFRGACCLHQHLWNVGKLIPDYMVQQPSRQLSLMFFVQMLSEQKICFKSGMYI